MLTYQQTEFTPIHSDAVIKKLEALWRICILPEILGRWFTRRCDAPLSIASASGICFCRGQPSGHVVSCSNVDCPYANFHTACLSLSEVPMLKTWYCPHCIRLAQFKQRRSSKKSKQSPAVNKAAMLCSSICVCNTKATATDRLLECHGISCGNGNFFHLSCLGLRRMPNNAKTTWQCEACRKKNLIQGLFNLPLVLPLLNLIQGLLSQPLLPLFLLLLVHPQWQTVCQHLLMFQVIPAVTVMMKLRSLRELQALLTNMVPYQIYKNQTMT